MEDLGSKLLKWAYIYRDYIGEYCRVITRDTWSLDSSGFGVENF